MSEQQAPAPSSMQQCNTCVPRHSSLCQGRLNVKSPLTQRLRGSDTVGRPLQTLTGGSRHMQSSKQRGARFMGMMGWWACARSGL